jgi:biotin synthase
MQSYTSINYENPSQKDLLEILKAEDKTIIDEIYRNAYSVKTRYVGKKVYFRGLIEISNVCEKNCLYCGIRKDNKNVERYMMQEDEIVEHALQAYELSYGSIVIQSGEIKSDEFTAKISRVIEKIKTKTDGKLGITLSLGEQSPETYRQWYDAGAHRYLLRIETSNRALYASLHPADHSFDKRVEALKSLRSVGYFTGTGVMIALPGQTYEDLVDDIIFFKNIDVDMIGMGPYLPHHDAPLAASGALSNMNNSERLTLSLKMISAVRLFLKDVNIAATTALQALDPFGREMGLKAGANIIMPNVTETRYRAGYQLYDNKPCLDENANMCRDCLDSRISTIGEEIGYGEWGDSPHYANRHKYAV